MRLLGKEETPPMGAMPDAWHCMWQTVCLLRWILRHTQIILSSPYYALKYNQATKPKTTSSVLAPSRNALVTSSFLFLDWPEIPAS